MITNCLDREAAQQRWRFVRHKIKSAGLMLMHTACALLGLYAIFFTYLSLSQVTHEKRLRDVQRLLVIGLLDAESGQRAFLLTDDRAFLVQYEAGLKSMSVYEATYGQALRGVQSRELFEHAQALISLKRAEMQLTIATHDAVSPQAAATIVRNHVGHRYTEEVYDLLEQVQQAEAHQVAPFELWRTPKDLDLHDPNRVLSPAAWVVQLTSVL